MEQDVGRSRRLWVDSVEWIRNEGLDHEEAVREMVAGILVSPRFSYRVLSAGGVEPTPLPPYELASRLSYFLWSSMPDATLFACAADGSLSDPEVLLSQARRMIQNERLRGFAVEFGGQWLDFRRFQEINSVDRERFPSFDDALREAMFEEPVRFIEDLIQRDRPVLDCLYGTHTFVNRPLAVHYGMEGTTPDGEEWIHVEDARPFGRGGLLSMGSFLTMNAPGRRTSPVKRGYWVVRRLLGELIPAPPAEVPELPADESATGELTLPELLERHRADKSCAACHDRFDAIGLVFEGYGPVGERRERDLGGRPVQEGADFPDGTHAAGVEGLRDYLRRERQDDFMDHLCRKLTAYGLGRNLLLSDEALSRTESILDRVGEHAREMSRQVSRADQAKLDEYLTSVREVERRVEQMRLMQDKAVERADHRGRPVQRMPRPDNGLPEDIREHMRLMCDLIALAFQTDKTRVATLLLCRDLSGLFYPFLDVRMAHHPASHDDRSEAYERVTRFYCSQLAYLATRLDAMPEGEGTVLDNSCLMFLSNMWSGSRHDSSKVPLVMVGALGGSLETGRVLDHAGEGDENRKLCSLYLSLMDRMGVTLDRFGDADNRLVNL